VRTQHRGNDVRNVHVGLTLRAIAQDAQLRRVVEQPAREVEADPVRLTRADHVAEAESAAREPEHERVAGDQRFTGQLARAIRGNGQ
jgi:hypothetical protein